MNLPQPIDKTRPLIWFLIALVLFLFIGTSLFVTRQRAQLLEQVRDHADRELHLLGAVITQDMIKHDFVGVREYLSAFVRQYADIYSIKVTAPNGFVLAEHRRTGDVREPFTRSYCVDIEPPSDRC